MLGGIHNADGIALTHRFIEDVKLDTAHLIANIVDGTHGALYAIGREIAVGAAWIAKGHGIGAILIALSADMGILARMVRDVVFAVFGRSVVLVGINAEDAEVAGLAGPHPVVGVTTILAQTLWWGIDKAHIIKALIDGEEVFAALIERVHLALNAFSAIIYHIHELRRNGVDDGVAFPLASTCRHRAKDEVSYINGLDVEEHIKALVRQFVGKGVSDEAILEVVMLGGGVVLNGTETTMVVGEHQAIVGHNDTGTEATQLHNGVVERGLLGAVKFFGRKFKSK